MRAGHACHAIEALLLGTWAADSVTRSQSACAKQSRSCYTHSSARAYQEAAGEHLPASKQASVADEASGPERLHLPAAGDAIS